MTSESKLDAIYDELLLRIQHIGIALQGKVHRYGQKIENYDLGKNVKPTIGETVDAFQKWNCAILTAFRSDPELRKNYNAGNRKRNEKLKKDLHTQNLLFRAVDGWYKEYGTEEYVKELSMFVTNTDINGNLQDSKEFFKKLYRCAEHYEQDCFLFTFPGINRVAFLIATNDNGRCYFRSNIHFAGPLYTHIEGLDAWTQCKDGKISFMLKGMILMGGTGNKRIKIGEGDIFDTESYNPDGLVIICQNEQKDLKKSCNEYDGTAPLIKRYFLKENQTKEDIEEKVLSALNTLIRDSKIAKKKKFRIGFHCSANIDGSSTKAAKIVIETVKKWADRKRIKNRLDSIVLVDMYGDYGRAMNEVPTE